ncbi:hypothetical protein CMV00_11830 [Elizabethkingia anophelis]|nr:hypothetical protein [Elizabethkingia anophelis]
MDNNDIFAYLKIFFSSTGALICTAVLSVIIGIYLEKFKSKLIYIKYRIFYSSIGTTIQNKYWGNIEVLYEGRPINHINLVTIELVNDSNVDIENINIDINVDQDSRILGNNGYYEKEGISVLLESGYIAYYNDVFIRSEEDRKEKVNNPNYTTPEYFINELNWISKNRKFNLPVMNRNTSVILNVLTENINGNPPVVRVSTLQKSVKLMALIDKNEQDKIQGTYTIIWGIIFFIISTVLIQFYFPESTKPIIVLGICGLLYLIVGFFIFKIIRYLKKKLS